MNFLNNIFSIILGRFYTEKEVGDYNQANSWNYKGHVLITGMVNSVAQPLFVQVADDAERQVRAFRKMLRFTAFISFPAMLGISLIAPELIVIAGIAIEKEMKAEELRSFVFPHPTVGEILKEALC